MPFKQSLLLVSVGILASLTSSSDVQAYPGMQLRVDQSFVNLATSEIFYVLPAIAAKINTIIPKELDILNIQIKEISLTNFQIDPSRAAFTIDKARQGIKMDWAELITYDFHCKVYYNIFWPLSFSFNFDAKLRNVVLNNGLSITANDHTGTPSVKFFDTSIDLGKSSISMTGNLAMWLIGMFGNLFKLPLQILLNLFFEPAVNFALNEIVIPLFLHNGLFEISTTAGKIVNEPLVIDLTLPENPQFHDDTLDAFMDGAVFFKPVGELYKPPTTPMRFQLEDYNFQFVVSSFAANQFLEVVLETGLVVLPIYYNMLLPFTGFDLTTTLFFVIIPELFYNYGSKNVNMIITPLSGTNLDWSQQQNATDAHIKALVDFQIIEADNSTVSAFQAVMDIDADFTLEVFANKTVEFLFSKMTISAFNVTQDNCGAKKDEAGIQSRLNEVMAAVEATINSVIRSWAPKLPEFSTFNYTVSFDYQDSAWGIGMLLTENPQ